ncbi:MAG: pyruvate kinase [Hyphomicrobium sp.]|nr:pyruvate kinase [Hyphomicrobium sp.]
MRRNRRVKIVATLGPASAAPEMVERLFLAGVDVFRINMSHSTHEGSKTLYNTVRACAARHRHPIGILADLQGPKFRVGEFQSGRVQVPTKSIFRFDRAEVLGDPSRVFLPHTQIFDAIEVGHNLVLDDGKLRMRVIERSDVQIVTEVITGGMLASRKGISMPDTLLPISPLTEKDKADLSHALKLGVDWVALSFVQRAEDLHEVRKLIGDKANIVSKIEKPSAVTDLEDIIAASDGIMVARGDLGVELPVEKVPGIQKRITRMARAAGKPVIVATQMLESMIASPMPTRAEVSDVATAVFDGADAIMLSAESAVGQFPTEAIQMMDKIAIEVEHDPVYEAILYATQTEPQPTGADAIAAAASAIANTVKLGAIVCYTATGSTVLRVTRERPGIPVIGLTPIESTARRLSLVWGVQSILTGDPENLSHMVRKACRIAFEEGLVKPRDGILITAGVPLGSPGATNMIRIAFVDESGAPIAEEV